METHFSQKPSLQFIKPLSQPQILPDSTLMPKLVSPFLLLSAAHGGWGGAAVKGPARQAAEKGLGPSPRLPLPMSCPQGHLSTSLVAAESSFPDARESASWPPLIVASRPQSPGLQGPVSEFVRVRPSKFSPLFPPSWG